MNISIVIPNYNGENILKKNIGKVLEAVKEYKKGKVEIIIVDDCSEDTSREVLHDIITHNHTKIDIHTLNHEKNLGFSSTVNTGVKKAKGDIIVLLNTDVIPQSDFLKKLPDHFAEKDIFAVGFMDKSIEGDRTVLRGRGIGQWKRGFLMHAAGDVKKTTTLWASGGSSAFRKLMWDTFGGFSEVYNPFYWEDIDLSYRALKTNHRVLFDPEITVIHEHEKGAIRTNYSPFHYKVIAHRNALFFIWLNITDSTLFFSHLIWLPYHFIKTIIVEGFAFPLALLQAVVKLPQILQERERRKKEFTRTDRQVLREHSL